MFSFQDFHFIILFYLKDLFTLFNFMQLNEKNLLNFNKQMPIVESFHNLKLLHLLMEC